MLVMRVQTQPILDKVGLTEAHIEVSNRQMVIVGECGQPLINIKGIQFSRSTINGKEREIAIELLSKFIDKNKKDIEHYLAEKKAYKKLVCPTEEDLNDICIRHGFKVSKRNYNFIVSFTVEDITISLNKEKQIFTSSAFNVSKIIKEFILTEKCIVELQDTIESINRYNESAEKLQNLRNSLGTCSI